MRIAKKGNDNLSAVWIWRADRGLPEWQRRAGL
jgi:hypothetical protein